MAKLKYRQENNQTPVLSGAVIAALREARSSAWVKSRPARWREMAVARQVVSRWRRNFDRLLERLSIRRRSGCKSAERDVKTLAGQ